MKVIRSGGVLVIVVAIIGAVMIKQNMRIRSLKKSQRSLATQNQGLSASNASLLSIEVDQNSEIDQLQQQPSEVLKLRSQVTQAWEQLAAARATNQFLTAESTNEFGGYVTREQMKFVGFDTPENAFQSLNWAAMSGDYTNWLAALSPAAQEEELGNPRSRELFGRGNSKVTGWQVVASKPVGNDRMELKVRFDTENAVGIMIYPMVAIGNEWRLGGEIKPYTQAWDSSSGAQ